MSRPGFMSLLNQLTGATGIDSTNYIGRRIASAILEDNQLILEFTDDLKIALFDDGDDGGDMRYMSTDDDLTSLVGFRFLGIESKPGPAIEGVDGEHETCFVEITTDGGSVTLVNHNHHNGYYGGFSLSLKAIPPSRPVFSRRQGNPDSEWV